MTTVNVLEERPKNVELEVMKQVKKIRSQHILNYASCQICKAAYFELGMPLHDRTSYLIWKLQVMQAGRDPIVRCGRAN